MKRQFSKTFGVKVYNLYEVTIDLQQKLKPLKQKR